MPDSPIAEEMTDNEALRYLVAELRVQNDFLLGRYASLAGNNSVLIDTIDPVRVNVHGTLNPHASPLAYLRTGWRDGVRYYRAGGYYLFTTGSGVWIIQPTSAGFTPAANRWESPDGITGAWAPVGTYTGTPVVTLESVINGLADNGSPFESGVEAAPGTTILRAANALAIKTVLTNLGYPTGTGIPEGSQAIRVYEGGHVDLLDSGYHAYSDAHLVAILEPGESWVSPLTGRGEIAAQCVQFPSYCAISTYLAEA